MKLLQAEANARSTASPATVYAVAKDSSRYPEWSRIGAFEHVRDGAGEACGVGSRRIFRTWPLNLLEEVVELVPERRVAYVVPSGLPFRDYRADIEIEPLQGGGTAIRWHNRFYAKYRGTGFLCRAFMQKVFDDMVPALAREAERIEREAGATRRAA